MSETAVADKDTLPEGGQSSVGGKDGSTSKETETFTKEQVQKFVSDALAKQGREHKAVFDPIVKERDTYKSQVENNTSDLEENKAEIVTLQSRIDDLASGDPDRFNAVKEMRALKDRGRQLQVRERELQDKERTHGERIKKAEGLEREVLILEIAEGYEGASAEKLTALCSTFNATSDEQIRKVADTLWGKKTTVIPETPPVTPFSGKTQGGSDNLANLPPAERVKEVDRRLRLK